MFHRFYYLVHTIILFINIDYLKAFNVNFHNNYNLQVEPFNTQIYKREFTQFFDKASFSFNGFEKVESIPVLFPIDICVISLDGFKYAATLHMERNETKHFKVLKMVNGSYELIADIPSFNGIGMDCINYNNKGYIAIALNITEPIQYANEGSPIYEITGNRIRAVQYFATPNLTSIYLRASGNDFFLLHTYANSHNNTNLYCPYFKWSGSTFNKLGRIPCSNARQLTPFSIEYESYVAVANYADLKGHYSINSEIYKYSRDKKKFLLFQKIGTNGAVDVQYFSLPQNEVRRQHFLIFANSISTPSLSKREKDKRESFILDANSIFYLFDKGKFTPYQELALYAVKKILPVQNVESEKFMLLVACADQDIKIYNFNDWKFEESKVQFTEGAFGKGVSNMRIYQENGNSYLIIANKLMGNNEYNIFLPIFKQEQHANELRQQIIDWANAETQRLKTINVRDLGKGVEEKLNNLKELKLLKNTLDVPYANIGTVATESLVYSKLKMSSNYWVALNFVNQALNNLATMLEQKQRLKRGTDFASYEKLEYVYEALNIKTLIVNKELNAKTVNEINSTKPQFENINAKKVVVSKRNLKAYQERVGAIESLNYGDENGVMTVKNVQISGKLNEYIWSDLLDNTLKRKEKKQFLSAPTQIETLKTDTLIVNNDIINGHNLGSLIPVDGGKYVINQDIEFDAPITVNQLKIFERFNNLHVVDGEFDVLLKKSNKTQVMEGLKNVTNIKVMESITLADKNIGPQLEAISPNIFNHDSLVLSGNFMVNGDVNINHQLNALDLIDLNEKLSTKQSLDMGIRMDKSLKDVNIKFVQPLMANNSIVSFVNQLDLQRLIKLNQSGIQIIEGRKVFNESLEIKIGFSEVKNLNGIDFENLENKAFLKYNNQRIKVPMKIGKLSAISIQSPILLINSKNISDYLTLNGNQSIQGFLNVENLKAQFVTVEHINTDSKIFYQSLQDIYQQKSRNAPPAELFKLNRKFHGSIYVQNVVLNSTINNKSIQLIENKILQLEGNIKYVGNIKFNYPMNVTNMTFQGKLNDIEAEEFGRCWLQKNAHKQVFTAAQSFATIYAERGIQLQGKLNGFTMEDFHTKTYWINRSEYIKCLKFENPIEITGYLTTKTLNENLLPQNVFLKNSKEKPNIIKLMTVNENIIVEGRILNAVSINNTKLKELQEFLDGSTGHTLYVDSVYFYQSPPIYQTLNSHCIRKTLDSVWLANENVILTDHVEIIDANFEGLLEFEGPINNINLDYLNENYLSKTRLQDIFIELIFAKGAKVEKEVNINQLQVFGPLIESNSEISIKFNEFVQNTLKTTGPHIISANWSFAQIIIEGNLNRALINQLSLVHDIMIKSTKSYIKMSAPKTFKNVNIGNLYAEPSSSINRVTVADWVKDAVYLYENYTIKGVTTMDSLHVYNNLICFGKLNNIKFNEHHLLLQNKNQHITGSMQIVSHLAQENRFLTNNMEQLYVDYINSQHVPSFIEKLIPAAAITEVKSHLTFKHALKVEGYEGYESFLTENQWSKRNIKKHIQLNGYYHYTIDETLKEFNEITDYLNHISKIKIYKLEHFKTLQTMEVNSDELLTFSLKIDNLLVDILAVFDKKVTIYKWITEINKFRETTDFDWLPHDPLLLKVIHKRYVIYNQPIDGKELKTFIHQDLKIFYNILLNANFDNYFEFSNETCMKFQNKLITHMELNMFCLNSHNSHKLIVSNDKVIQIISFRKKHFALLTNSSVLIYDTSSNPTKLLQKLPLTKPKQIALGSLDNYEFLAVSSYGFVEIYRSVNFSAFTLFQSLKCSQALQIEFSFIKKSNDFLIHVLTDSTNKPYFIYQYRGVMGFKEMLSDSVLPRNLVGFDILNLYSNKQYLVALNSKNEVTMMELSITLI